MAPKLVFKGGNPREADSLGFTRWTAMNHLYS